MQDVIDKVLGGMAPKEDDDALKMMKLLSLAKKAAARKLLDAIKADDEDALLACFRELDELTDEDEY